MNGTENNREKNRWFIQTRHLIYYLLGLIEALLAFRLIFKLLGANPASGFVSFIYGITGIFAAPFAGIFRTVSANGLEAKAVLEPATIIAMAVYAILAHGLVRLIKLKVLET